MYRSCSSDKDGNLREARHGADSNCSRASERVDQRALAHIGKACSCTYIHDSEAIPCKICLYVPTIPTVMIDLVSPTRE